MRKMTFPLALLLIASASPAMAYVGPGSSLGAVGLALGLVGTILLALISFIWYPIRRALRRMRRAATRSQRVGHR
jgi:hypothetical protein